MKTVTIPEDEYLQIQQAVSDLKKQAELIQHDDFIKKISLIYRLICERQGFAGNETEKISLKRGSGQGIITYTEVSKPIKSARGRLKKYADPGLISEEESAWKTAVKEKYYDL
ncbi:MAG: hypothetical protein BWK80_62635 [Desulfobacteraceae bacterium IS3]|nr:MAG: hypothetical protein BWK80_62635 [Desulfobacteraceae bacterium IS3]